MDQSQLNWITSFIWNIADDVLRDLYERGKYRDVILPMPRRGQVQLIDASQWFVPLRKNQGAKNCRLADADIARTEREIALLHEYRTRLIADVVRGKLDVREAARHLPVEAVEPVFTVPAEDADEEAELEPEEATP